MSLPALRRPAHPAVALAAVASLVLAGCSGAGSDNGDGPGDPGKQGPRAQSVADGSTPTDTWPLTGLPVTGEGPDHPVLVVKVDNSSSSSPQLGLGEADLVVEELVEGGTTRLAVFYHSQLPEVAGPVRSMRATDIGIVAPAGAVLVASGGAPPTVRRVAEAGITTFTEGAKGYTRDSGRVTPYNLMMNLPELAATVEATEPPAGYLPWGEARTFPDGRPAKRLSAVFSSGHTTTWELAGGTYTHLDGYAAENDRFRPDTVLVLRVRVGDAGYRDPAGNPVPETRLTGTGEAMVFHDGRVVRGTWAKDGLDGALSLETEAGALTIPPGKVWIELVPARDGDVRVG